MARVCACASPSTEAERQLKVVTKNMALLRERYNKLVEESQGLRDQLAQAQGDSVAEGTPKPGDSTFVKDLTEAATGALNSQRLSDITLVVGGGASSAPAAPTDAAADGASAGAESSSATATATATATRLPAHRWLLRARSKLFQNLPLEEMSEYAFEPSVTPELAQVLLRYLYTDQVDLGAMSDTFALRVLAISDVHGLSRLRQLTETLLVGMVARTNCGMMLAQADKLKALELRKAAMQVILNEFDSLRPADLADVDSTLMAEIYRGRTPYPIHLAVTTGREDVVFLFLLDHTMHRHIDDLDDHHKTALQLALEMRKQTIADALVEHGANASRRDPEGRPLLIWAIESADWFAASYLMSHGTDVEAFMPVTGKRPIHIAVQTGQTKVAQALLAASANVNAQAYTDDGKGDGTTALHLAVARGDRNMISLLVEQPEIDLNVVGKSARPAMLRWCASRTAPRLTLARGWRVGACPTSPGVVALTAGQMQTMRRHCGRPCAFARPTLLRRSSTMVRYARRTRPGLWERGRRE